MCLSHESTLKFFEGRVRDVAAGTGSNGLRKLMEEGQ